MARLNVISYFKKLLLQFVTEPDPLLSMLQWLMQQLMQLEAESKVGAQKNKHLIRPPLSLKKLGIEENRDATVISFISESEFFRGKTETFPVLRFFLELTSRRSPLGGIFPPKAASTFSATHLYAALRRTARTKGKWPDKPPVARLAPAGWKRQHQQADQDVQPYDAEATCCVSDQESARDVP